MQAGLPAVRLMFLRNRQSLIPQKIAGGRFPATVS
jgi:hypothetical protein